MDNCPHAAMVPKQAAVAGPLTRSKRFRKESTKMATDPVCGMIVDEEIAISEEFDGETFYFCCEACRDQFLVESEPADLEGSLE
jgi:YHS domain-containing protein